MRILLTNDDGLKEEGIRAFAEALGRRHEVWLIAPDRNRSAVSHSITMHEPLRIVSRGERTFTCSGTPADCVICGVKAVLPGRPDAVFSGINRGANIGTDVIYSGTVAAARQATIYGIPALAASVESKDGVWRYAALAEFISLNAERLISLCDPDVLLNINAKSADSYKGYALTFLSRRRYRDSIRLYEAPDGHSYSFFASASVDTIGGEGDDGAAVERGFISITRVRAHPSVAETGTEVQFEMP